LLYLVATPIGNLKDITLRALEVLEAVDLVASEDTRVTGRLLKHYDLHKRQIAFHEHNKERAVERVVGALREGLDVALVTNAGTPGISDPGYSVVKATLAEGFGVTMIPGANAIVPAVVLSGLPVHSFCFRGFLPRKAGARRRTFEGDAALPYTLVYYASPHRLEASLQDALEVLGDREAALANDLTKLYEAVYRGRLSELLARIEAEPPRGEYVLVIEGAGE
jgi:16S rRNA (cytidine1402-2'-O)-methyltransferase